MALRYFENKITKEIKKTLKASLGEEWEELLVAPETKFMITADAVNGKSKLKDQDKMLRARARNYSRDVELDDTIQLNTANGLVDSVNRNLLNSKQERRRKIDDI